MGKYGGNAEAVDENDKDKPKVVFNTDSKLAISAGALVTLGVAWNRFKAMVSGKAQTEEEIEAGEEPEKKGIFSKVVNGVVALASAAAAVSLVLDAKNGKKFGETGRSAVGSVIGKWTAKRADEIANGQGQGNGIV